ncbi:putative glycosyltransferase, exosortase G system-associated [Anoxybacterium hadale]|uniref:Glycosyltransferase, exosortase G system-associated n=1 Tax=Anoxybacterium hadale TaxID=3408580 RepID=A0ACD1A9C7_9FIRM|nr:putative glycosyltransferase, exosortase G system-associated [Clostridiales bacterium]
MSIVDYFASPIVFWMAWVIIPLLLEIIPALGGVLILIKKMFFGNKVKDEVYYPEICIIIPIYNSAKTLRACIASIDHSTYPKHMIRILLVHNQGSDDSFLVFQQCQKEFPELMIQWLSAKQGKSKALNLALFNSEGKYIIHIDSDGRLQSDALSNLVQRFEENSGIHCMTGVILTDWELVEESDKRSRRLLRRLEFLEYAQAFLAGRNYDSELNMIYTLSGAFSAFRKSTILKSQLYHTGTVSEDTQLTFQVKLLLKQRVHLCENAIFLSEPILGLNELYTQRQRWQRGELEVSNLFSHSRKSIPGRPMIKTLLYDHTFAFPRMIWYFALGCLAFKNYSMVLILFSVGLIFLLYVLTAYLYYLTIIGYLRGFGQLQRYYIGLGGLVALLPFYNFAVFWIRLAGIINSIDTESSWKTMNLTEERSKASASVRRVLAVPYSWLKALRKAVNRHIES